MSDRTITEKLYEEQKEATRAKDRFRLSVLRMVRSELQNEAIAKKAPLEAEEELAVLAHEAKKRHEALDEFKKAGRQDLADDLAREIEILKKYLPEQFSESELEKLVRDAVAESGAVSKRDMGKVMGLIMARVKGKADGNLVRRMVENILG
ncbi:MAG: GatB/YqeY domain-containing protein [Bacillota bacterium]|nr:GatB/YqeY domain-containing protein [Bacillota bacterium]